jgi:hypothetical protein
MRALRDTLLMALVMVVLSAVLVEFFDHGPWSRYYALIGLMTVGRFIVTWRRERRVVTS